MKYIMLLICLSSVASAKNNKNLPKTLAYESNDYFLCKQHTIRYAYFIKVAYVGLYLNDCSIKESLLNIDDKIIRFNYQVNVEATVFSEAAEEFYVKNLKSEQDDKTLSELKNFNKFYVNISASDWYDLYHKKGEKLQLYKNDKLLGSSFNKYFSSNYFNIWFGKHPAIKKLKQSFIKS